MQATGGADNVDDGVHGTHLVEMDRIESDPVDLGLGFAEAPEDSAGLVTNRQRQGGSRQHAVDFVPGAVGLVLFADHFHPGTADTVPLLLADRQ